jgi:hypothetical protein
MKRAPFAKRRSFFEPVAGILIGLQVLAKPASALGILATRFFLAQNTTLRLAVCLAI